MTPKYLPTDRNGRLFQLIEECGEVLQALGKAGRFGMGNRYPQAPDEPTNAEKILGELADLRSAMDAVEPDLREFARDPEPVPDVDGALQ